MYSCVLAVAVFQAEGTDTYAPEGLTQKLLFDMFFFCSINIFCTRKAGYLHRITVWYISKAAICCHIDRHTIKKIIPGGLI